MHKPETGPSKAELDQLRLMGYEQRDISLGFIFKAIAVLFSFFIVTAGITYIVYALFVSQEVSQSNTHLPSAAVHALPDGTPMLQGAPKVDIVDFRAQEDGRVNGYGWKDRQKGILRIPVRQAMQRILSYGFAAPEKGPIPPAPSGATGPLPHTAGTEVTPLPTPSSGVGGPAK